LLDYEFYQANTLGGLSNLRGFRRSRFSGRSSFYHNLEARLKLLSFKSYLFPAHLGVLAFNDLGRVWNPMKHLKNGIMDMVVVFGFRRSKWQW
jgi:hemolysin activation/secretion protein